LGDWAYKAPKIEIPRAYLGGLRGLGGRFEVSKLPRKDLGWFKSLKMALRG